MFVEAFPSPERLLAVMGMGGLYYFRCKNGAHRERLRADIMRQALETNTPVKCQTAYIEGAFMPVLKVEINLRDIVYPTTATASDRAREEA